MIKSGKTIELYTKNYLVRSPKASILIVHGLHEHCERYAPLATFLNNQNMDVYTFDLRGHGQSTGPKNIIKDIDEYRQDVENVYRTIPQGIPFFILGHSMGGLVVVHFLQFRFREDVKGVVLSGAALELGKDVPPYAIPAVKVMGKLFPHLKAPAVNPYSISRDLDQVEVYKTDPLITLDGVKAGLGLALVNAIKDAKSKFKHFDYPILVMHGSDDKITNPEGSKLLFAQAAVADKTLRIWEGAYHEIFNETNSAEVIRYTADWIKSRI